mmetsp:Transcript_33521/g.46774  ORF Transcript_33521/g.46774 Transcript_33521/m.46774 type:complete len:120 (+) Transcript_33521:238-597(+)|eukprot:CAMPEP_0185255056 /NCGR_PEP_ID=MMETSP1359-20130426/4031_1 /TAXON_ID=552665 /ORGANISM="Bigelowiella longifila, Strain CCMP242" /LENGTH=119 /DNA_ID=CAMNT_0027838651 /DNA_START=173 /DNA_END=532 /DNA_ORIENTATION=+
MEFLRELITDFMIDFDSKKELNSEHLKQLAKDQKAVEALQSFAHGIKGCALNIALSRVAALSLELETQARSYNGKKKCPTDEEAKKIQEIWNTLCDEVKKVKEQHDSIIKAKENEDGQS